MRRREIIAGLGSQVDRPFPVWLGAERGVALSARMVKRDEVWAQWQGHRSRHDRQ
jgi:hypothetical protein